MFRDFHSVLARFVLEQGIVAVFLFIGIYAGSVALSIPGASILSIAGGFLFGQWLGSLYVIVAATLGAVGVFFIAQTTVGYVFQKRTAPFHQRLKYRFQENAFNYLLLLRLIPIFPFFLVNVIPAFLGVSFRTFVSATCLGVIPGSFVFASFGNNLDNIFLDVKGLTLLSIFTPGFVVTLIGLAVMVLLPVVFKKLKSRTP